MKTMMKYNFTWLSGSISGSHITSPQMSEANLD